MGVIILYMVVREVFSEKMEIRIEGGKRASEGGITQAERSASVKAQSRSACSEWHCSCKAS